MLVAAQLWSEKGYAAVGIREISRAVHLTPGALYHYMGTKEELLQRIMQQTIAPLVQSAGAVLSSDGSILSRLDALVALHVRAHATDQLHTRITDLEYRSLTGESQRAMALLRQEYEAVWRTLIRQARLPVLSTFPTTTSRPLCYSKCAPGSPTGTTRPDDSMCSRSSRSTKNCPADSSALHRINATGRVRSGDAADIGNLRATHPVSAAPADRGVQGQPRAQDQQSHHTVEPPMMACRGDHKNGDR